MNATSQYSTTVPEPTPANVMPLISLSAPITAPPCHTRTYCRVPELSVGSVPPYVLPVTPSTSAVVGALVGALPSRMRPPHWPREPSAPLPVAESESESTVSEDAFSGSSAVKVMGASAAPSATIMPPFSTMIAGALPSASLGAAYTVTPA